MELDIGVVSAGLAFLILVGVVLFRCVKGDSDD